MLSSFTGEFPILSMTVLNKLAESYYMKKNPTYLENELMAKSITIEYMGGRRTQLQHYMQIELTPYW